ncbi:lipoprotein [Streptomyces sp. NPDC008141]|uniref:lipoprotein n=1 Tax=Streptomyces sp. NPDC008141 TaxID=3364815 RepID=UPI0036E15B2B
MGARALPAALLLGVVTGCAAEQAPKEPAAGAKSTATGKSTAGAPAGAVAKGGSIGGKGSACVLPVAFDLASGWSPEAVRIDAEFGALKHGPVTLVCEIDAKPAGNVGYLRVWTGGAGATDPRAALEAFVAEESKSNKDVAYTKTTVGGFAAAEVTYLNTDEFLDAPKKERALAFAAPRGLVVLHLGGMDSEEHEQMLPAYELAKKSVHGV